MKKVLINSIVVGHKATQKDVWGWVSCQKKIAQEGSWSTFFLLTVHVLDGYCDPRHEVSYCCELHNTQSVTSSQIAIATHIQWQSNSLYHSPDAGASSRVSACSIEQISEHVNVEQACGLNQERAGKPQPHYFFVVAK